MRLSAKTEYACVAMIELAAGYTSHEPVRIRKIADEHDTGAVLAIEHLIEIATDFVGWKVDGAYAFGGICRQEE